jgi:methionine synthase II (cobalamin-independent)
MANTSRIPTEPIGSVPRPQLLQHAMQAHAAGTIADVGTSRVKGTELAETVQE